MSNDIIATDRPPARAATRTGEFAPNLQLSVDHDLCPGCGEPLALRLVLELIEELGYAHNAIGVVGIGCYTALGSSIGVDMIQALHGRAPSLATGAKRMRPDTLMFTLQGDGDMVSEGLQEVIHTAARGENVTCVLLNNGVFGETGGHMTATTVLGQRTKNTLDGRDAARHGHPISLAEMLAPLGGATYIARAARCTTRLTLCAPRTCCAAPSRRRSRARASRWWRFSRCARPGGSCQRLAGRATSMK